MRERPPRATTRGGQLVTHPRHTTPHCHPPPPTRWATNPHTPQKNHPSPKKHLTPQSQSPYNPTVNQICNRRLSANANFVLNPPHRGTAGIVPAHAGMAQQRQLCRASLVPAHAGAPPPRQGGSRTPPGARVLTQKCTGTRPTKPGGLHSLRALFLPTPPPLVIAKKATTTPPTANFPLR